MVSVIVSKVSLSFPILTGSRAQYEIPGAHDDRLVKWPNGSFRAVRALRDISLSLDRGDRLGIIGPNGSGKTSLLQVVAGIYTPDSGEVRLTGRATSLINLSLGMQPEASGQRNITLKGLAYGHARAEIERKRQAIIEFCELGEFIDMPVMTYSSGMSMRLAFAIATAFEPEILILDEWLSTGDAAFRMRAVERMNSFARRAGVILLATHSKQLLLDNCNLGLWLERGMVRGFGDIKSVYASYEAWSNGSRAHALLEPVAKAL
ncbi:MAG: ABC transporter ATP-binding protein [Parvularculaceae bacterium]|nr:ABC transporter ATP-binding protein [Parvularculaceae bacterium]